MRLGWYRAAAAAAAAAAADGRGCIVFDTLTFLFHFKFFECVMKRARGEQVRTRPNGRLHHPIIFRLNGTIKRAKNRLERTTITRTDVIIGRDWN